MRRSRPSWLRSETVVAALAGAIAGALVTLLLVWLTPVMSKTLLAEPSCDDPRGLTVATPIAIEASSSMTIDPMAADPEHGHPPADAIDGDAGTAWAEGTEGTGIGESLTITLEPGTDLRMICVVNGWAKTFGIYRDNSRARQLEVSTKAGTKVSVLRDAGASSFQRFRGLSVVPGSTDYVTLTIRTTWSGVGNESAFDTSISELEFWQAG